MISSHWSVEHVGTVVLGHLVNNDFTVGLSTLPAQLDPRTWLVTEATIVGATIDDDNRLDATIRFCIPAAGKWRAVPEQLASHVLPELPSQKRRPDEERIAAVLAQPAIKLWYARALAHETYLGKPDNYLRGCGAFLLVACATGLPAWLMLWP